MARFDCFLKERTGKIFLNEINTIRGVISIRLYPRLWAVSGMPYSKLIDCLIELALERRREKIRTRYSLR